MRGPVCKEAKMNFKELMKHKTSGFHFPYINLSKKNLRFYTNFGDFPVEFTASDTHDAQILIFRSMFFREDLLSSQETG